ncbi:MAG: hypothetical protein R3B96_04610 [Pirellulaceae bacterium]
MLRGILPVRIVGSQRSYSRGSNPSEPLFARDRPTVVASGKVPSRAASMKIQQVSRLFVVTESTP